MAKEKKMEPVDPWYCGPVLFIKGKYKGRAGYYDDDEGNKAIVYLGEPFASQYVTVPHNYLVKADGFVPLMKWKKKHPKLAKDMGVG